MIGLRRSSVCNVAALAGPSRSLSPGLLRARGADASEWVSDSQGQVADARGAAGSVPGSERGRGGVVYSRAWLIMSAVRGDGRGGAGEGRSRRPVGVERQDLTATAPRGGVAAVYQCSRYAGPGRLRA